jgi:DNA-binding winged helix-turn-helix (wHTH) protein
MALTPRLTFDRFAIDPQARRLSRDNESIPLADRHFDVLHSLASNAGTVVSKNALVQAGWGDVAVTDNSLEQAVSALRRALGNTPDGRPYIETVPRRGYRFNAIVSRSAPRETDASLDALLGPHRAWLEGRAALETLEREQIVHAREVFNSVLGSMPEHALAHVGLANACAMQFETTRTDAAPDVTALSKALEHAREACRLDAQSAEAWATLGFVLDRCGKQLDANAALRRAVTLEPDNWRHHFRLAYASWGQERLRSARRTLDLLPGFPLAHWIAATVHVARNALDEAERELTAGIAVQTDQGAHARFSAVALHWLNGLIRLARGDEAGALEAFERELSCESSGQLYARECCANTWYAIGALRLRQRRSEEARIAFQRAIDRVAMHPSARLTLSVLDRSDAASGHGHASPVDVAMGQAVVLVLRGEQRNAPALVEGALSDAPPGSAGWILPIEPLLHISADPAPWAPVLARLRARAA